MPKRWGRALSSKDVGEEVYSTSASSSAHLLGSHGLSCCPLLDVVLRL